MLARLQWFISVILCLSILAPATALPPPSTLHKKLLEDEKKKKRPRAIATPAPVYAPPAPTRTTSATTSTAAAPLPSRPSTVVVIDAGHGGHDRGGIPGQRVPEKVMALDVAQRVRSILSSNGYRTVMTRDRDVFVPLGTRVAIANSYRNSIFVCIHFNSATRRGANGIETYFYSSQSLPLASAIHYYVSRAAPSSNRGVRRRGYYVLRRTAVPAVLVECGFLTNPTEAQYAQSTSYRQMLAEQIARGVRSRTLIQTSSGARYASNESVPIQPYIDQTRVRDPDISGRRRSKKSSRSKKSAAVRKKKKSSEKSSSGSSTKKKKKSKSKKSED